MSLPTLFNQTPGVLSFRPDESQDIELSAEEQTIVKEALDTSEERLQCRPRPFYGLSYTMKSNDPEEISYLRKTFEDAKDKLFACPIWPHKTMLTAAATAGDVLLTVDPMDNLLFTVCRYVLIWSDFQTWEVAEINPVIFSTLVSLVAPLENDWPAGDVTAPVYVLPLFFGSVKRPDTNSFTDQAAQVGFDFSETYIFPPIAREDGTELIQPPTISYGTCNETVTVDFGGTIANLKRFIVQHSDNPDGPWDSYCELRRERSRLVFNNYFLGQKYLRINFWMRDGSVIDSVYVFKPEAANVDPPAISAPGLTANLSARFPIGADFEGYTGGLPHSSLDNTALRAVTADQEQLDKDGNQLMMIPCGEAVIEADKHSYQQASISDAPTPSSVTVTITGPAGSTVKFTTDGSDPTSSHGSNSGTSVDLSAVGFGLVIIARAFKDGCKSPPVYIVIDREIESVDHFVTGVRALTSSGSCDLDNYTRTLPDCLTNKITRSCVSLYGSDVASVCADTFRANQLSILLAGSPGASSLKVVYENGDGSSISGATPDPGTCGPGTSWTDGSLTMNFSRQIAAEIYRGTDSGYEGILHSFPDCLTAISVRQTNVDLGDTGIWNRTWKGVGFSKYFGPNRVNSALYIGGGSNELNSIIGTDGSDCVTFLVAQAELAWGIEDISSSFTVKSVCAVATLAPPASAIWNADDLT